MATKLDEVRKMLEEGGATQKKVVELMHKLSDADAKKIAGDRELKKLICGFDQEHAMDAINALRLTGKVKSEWMSAAGVKKYKIVEKADFKKSLEGVKLNPALLAGVTKLCEHLLDNNLVKADITFNEGVRSPATAHKWSTAYWIRQGKIDEDRLKKLTGGKDLDGNLWYIDGWTSKEIIVNAKSIWGGALAAEGYPPGDKRRLPNTDKPIVSNHCAGEAMDVSIIWRNGDGWHSEARSLVKKFSLRRPVPTEAWHFQL